MRGIYGAALALACLTALLWAGGAAAQGAEPRPRLEAWVDGVEVEYYDFGANSVLSTNETVATAPVWPLIQGFDADGNPLFVEGQHNIFDTVPGDHDYTDLWAVTFVTVPGDYVAESIRSLFEIEASGYPISSGGMLRNCPIVPEGTALAGGEVLRQGWVDGRPVSYFDFGPSSAMIAPAWIFIHGYDANGAPIPVEDQYAVFDSSPLDADYSAFRRISFVTVPDGFVPDSIRSAAQVRASGFPIEETDRVVNYPVVDVDGVETAPPGSYAGGAQAGDSTRLLAVVGVVIGAGIIATVGAFSLSRRSP